MKKAWIGWICLYLVTAPIAATAEVIFSLPFAEAAYPAGGDLNDHPDWDAPYDEGQDQGWPIRRGDMAELPESVAGLLHTSGNYVVAPHDSKASFDYSELVSRYIFGDGAPRTLDLGVLVRGAGNFGAIGRSADGQPAGDLASGQW